MLKTKKSKIIIGAVAILAVLAASSIWVMANMKSNSVDDFGYEALAQTGAATATLTQLDRIIQDSQGEGDDSNYKVYVITPSGEDISVIRDFFQNNDGFRNYVVNDNRTISDEMNPDKVLVTPITVGELNGMSAEDIATELGKADLIYLYASTAQSYLGGNAIGEDLYNYLHNYAFGLNKPLIMNFAGLDAGNKDDTEDKPDTPVGVDSKVFQLTTVTFKNSWKRTNTTKVTNWTSETEAANVGDTLRDYLTSAGSIYVPYTLNNVTRPSNYAGWADYWKRNGEDEATLNVLYIHGDTTDADAVRDSIQTEVDEWVKDGDHWNSVFNTAIDTNLPTKAVVTAAAAGDLNPEDFYGDDGVTKKYDYILIAPDTYGNTDLNDETVTELIKLSEDKSNRTLTYILFGALQGKTVSSGSGSSSSGNVSLTIDTTTNYGKLLDLSITTSGYAKKNNIMVVGVEYMNTLAKDPAKNPTKIAKLVALINKSTYRTHAGSGSGGGSGSISTTAYRVLELQPCYPIDLVLARSITDRTALSRYTSATGQEIAGNYYTIPANVLNTNEIDDYFDENGNVSSEYYQWDLSKAKVSYVLNMQGYSGITTDQIDLVQMSTEEYITAKADVSDAYDLIYIGGNMSALRSSSTYGVVNWGLNSAASTYKTAFSMYSHNNAELITWPNHNRITIDSQFSIALANDITYDRLVELKKYIDAGMPIVFSNEIWDAYEKACDQKYKNKYLDPDSNMFKLCAYAEEAAKKDDNTSVLTDWQVRQSYNEKMGYAAGSTDYKYFEDYCVSIETRVGNENGIYGTTDSVTVFGTDDNDVTRNLNWQLWACINGANTNNRPKFSITTTAISYVEGDASTELTERNVTWDVTLLAEDPTHQYTAYILEDLDDNGVFEIDAEQVDSQALIGGEANLSYSYPESDFGAFNWKILVVDETTGASASYSDITVFKRLEDQPKKSASVLEIIEMKQSQCSSSNPTSPDSHTFYLDTNYNQSSGNPYLYSSFGTTAYDNYGWAPVVRNGGATSSDPATYMKAYCSNDIAEANSSGYTGGQSGNLTFGKYQPSLSIGRFDATTGLEDRAYNYMSLVEDDYDFSLDIMYMDDIQYFSEYAHNSTEEEREKNLEAATIAKENYDAFLTEGTISYNQLKVKEDELIKALTALLNNQNYTCSNGTVLHPSDFNLYDLENIIESGNYFRFFFLNSGNLKGNSEMKNEADPVYAFYVYVYTPYTEINDIKIKYYREYRYYSMMAYGPEEYFAKNYDVIVVGFSDPYETNKITPFSETEAKDLQDFATAGGSLLLTHDVITKSNAVNLNTTGEYLRDFAGQNAFAGLTADESTGSNGYSKYTSLDTDRYFITNLSTMDDADLSYTSTLTGSAWDTAVGNWANRSQVGVRGGSQTDWQGVTTSNGISLMGLSDVYNIYRTSGSFALRYKYAEVEIENVIQYNMQVTGPLKVTGTTRAEAVNRGVVTTYPFYIATDLRVSATHPQSYTLDLENKNVTVWYTLAPDNKKDDGSVATTGQNAETYKLMKQNSSLMAASPKDGADNYYIYSIGNVTYCGAGQALITGDERDNNDERRLFLNVLLHMAKVRDGVEKKPEIVLYDPDGTTKAPGNVVKRDAENDYYIKVLSNVTYPEFAFGVENISSKITDVEVFYDLDYGMTGGIYDAEDFDTNAFMDNEDHVRISFPNKDEVIGILNSPNGVYIMSKENHPALVTKKEYFDGKNNLYGGKYTYIVVRITLEDGTILTRRIKIMLTRNLLDLT